MATVVDSYSESNQSSDRDLTNIGGFYSRTSQSFTGDGGTLNSVKFYLKKDGATGSIYAYIYAHTGTFGTSSKPTGSALATSDAVNTSTIGTSYGLITFTFSGDQKITLANGTKYCLVLIYNNDNNFVSAGMDASSPSHGGNEARYGASWSGSNSYDLCFYVYKDDQPVSVTITDTANSVTITNPNVTITEGAGVTATDTFNSLSFTNPDVSIIVTSDAEITDTVNELTFTSPNVTVIEGVGVVAEPTFDGLAFTNPDVTITGDALFDDSIVALTFYSPDVSISVEQNWGVVNRGSSGWVEPTNSTTIWSQTTGNSTPWQ